MSPDESLNVVRAVMRSEQVPADMAASILARAEGNPFFLEELARAAGRPDALGAATTSLEAVLSARIEALPEACRRVLRTASVLGRHFSRRLLDGVWTSPESPEPQLRELKRLDLLHERVRLDDASYSFKHALIQEAAYEGLSASERQALHAAVARTLEALHAGRPDEACELIAHHYLRSAETEKALEYLELSNRKATRASAMAEAKGYFEEAMKLLDRRPDTAETRRRRIALVVDQVLAMTLLFRFDEYRELLQRHESMAMALEEPGLRGSFLGARGVCEWAVGEYDRAIGTFAQAASLCEEAGDADRAALAYSVRQWAHLYKGEYEAALALLPSVARVLDGRSSPRWRRTRWGPPARVHLPRSMGSGDRLRARAGAGPLRGRQPGPHAARRWPWPRPSAETSNTRSSTASSRCARPRRPRTRPGRMPSWPGPGAWPTIRAGVSVLGPSWNARAPCAGGPESSTRSGWARSTS